MASSIIHYVIGKRIAEQIGVGDIERFLFGASIVPDASSHEDGSYDKAHFQGKTAEFSLKGIDWMSFERKYCKKFEEDSIYLGYWCHLITDAIWFHDMVDKHIRIYPRDIRPIYQQRAYDDYKKLNYLVKTEYDLEMHVFSQFDVPIEEVQSERIPTMINIFNGYFDAQECQKCELEIYNWDLITSYIEKCVAFCVREIEAMLKNTERVEPKRFYVIP